MFVGTEADGPDKALHTSQPSPHFSCPRDGHSGTNSHFLFREANRGGKEQEGRGKAEASLRQSSSGRVARRSGASCRPAATRLERTKPTPRARATHSPSWLSSRLARQRDRCDSLRASASPLLAPRSSPHSPRLHRLAKAREQKRWRKGRGRA